MAQLPRKHTGSFSRVCMNNCDTIKPTGSGNSREVFSLEEKQVLFNFKGFLDVLQERVGENHEALNWLSH